MATLTGKSGRPSIVIDKDWRIWLGNETSEVATFSSMELFGFGTGSFETKICRGGKRDAIGIAWRIRSDIELISVNKKLFTVCGFLHDVATRQGLAEVTIEDHTLAPKLHPATCKHSKRWEFQ